MSVTKHYIKFNSIEDFEAYATEKAGLGFQVRPLVSESLFDSVVYCQITNQMGSMDGLDLVTKDDVNSRIEMESKIEAYNAFKKDWGERVIESFAFENVRNVLTGGSFTNAQSNHLWAKFKRVMIPQGTESPLEKELHGQGSIYTQDRVVNIFDQLKAGSLESAYDAMTFIELDDGQSSDDFFYEEQKNAFLGKILEGIIASQGYLE